MNSFDFTQLGSSWSLESGDFAWWVTGLRHKLWDQEDAFKLQSLEGSTIYAAPLRLPFWGPLNAAVCF